MPKLLNTSGLNTCTRSLLTIISIPLQCRHTASPQEMRRGSPCCGHSWIISPTIPVTVTVKSKGSPDIGPIFPPRRRSSVEPVPPEIATWTAIGSHIIARPALSMPRSSRALSINVESLGAPPPGLSARSAMTTGPVGTARAWAKASSIDRGFWSSSWRRLKNFRPTSSATCAASSADPSVITKDCAPQVGTSPQGKQWARDTDRIPSLPSISIISSTKLRIGSKEVRYRPIIRQSNRAMVGSVLPSAASAMRRNRSAARRAISMCGYSL